MFAAGGGEGLPKVRREAVAGAAEVFVALPVQGDVGVDSEGACGFVRTGEEVWNIPPALAFRPFDLMEIDPVVKGFEFFGIDIRFTFQRSGDLGF